MPVIDTYNIELESGTVVSALPEEEICELYRRAKNRKQQIKILSELALISKNDVNAVLHKHGLIDKPKKIVQTSYSNPFTWTDELTSLLVEKYSQGERAAQIAEEFGAERKVIASKIGRLKKQGIIPHTNKQSSDVANSPLFTDNLMQDICLMFELTKVIGGQVVSVTSNRALTECTFDKGGRVYELTLQLIEA